MTSRYYKRSLLGPGVVVGAVLLAVLHAVATVLYLYWFYWWFDTAMHFLGGFWIALLFWWILKKESSTLTKERASVYLILITFALSVTWELFEIYIGYVDPTLGVLYWLDTGADVVAGVLGGAFAVLLLLYTRGDTLQEGDV